MPGPVEYARRGRDVLKREGARGLGYALAARFGLKPVRPQLIDLAPYAFSQKDLDDNAAILAAAARERPFGIRTMNWIIPAVSQVTGGVTNFLKIAQHLQERHGVTPRFLIHDDPRRDPEEVRALVAKPFPRLAEHPFVNVDRDGVAAAPHSDACIAVRWDGCYRMLQVRNTRQKLYLLNDIDTYHFPAGTAQALADQSYRFGFPRICTSYSTWLAAEAYGGPSMWFHQPVDHQYNFPPPAKPNGPVRITFYGRPGTTRNAFELGAGALRLVKERYGDRVEIIAVGERFDPAEYKLDGVITNLGVLDLASLGDLYRSAHVGLGLIYTPHPSLQGLEYWANGAAVVTNTNPYNDWIYRHEENCLKAPPSPVLLADCIGRLVEDKALRERLAANGQRFVQSVRWEDEIERVWRFMRNEPLPAREPV